VWFEWGFTQGLRTLNQDLEDSFGSCCISCMPKDVNKLAWRERGGWLGLASRSLEVLLRSYCPKGYSQVHVNNITCFEKKPVVRTKTTGFRPGPRCCVSSPSKQKTKRSQPNNHDVEKKRSKISKMKVLEEKIARMRESTACNSPISSWICAMLIAVCGCPASDAPAKAQDSTLSRRRSPPAFYLPILHASATRRLSCISAAAGWWLRPHQRSQLMAASGNMDSTCRTEIGFRRHPNLSTTVAIDGFELLQRTL
jgi:hypothetical protein